MPDTTDHAALSAQLATDLAAGDTASTAALFSSVGAPAPTLTWSPTRNDLPHTMIRRFADRCDGLGEEGGLLPEAAVTAGAFGPLHEWLMILKYDDDGALVFQHYGQGIAQVYGHDMTGQSTASFVQHIGAFFTAVYNAAAARRERILSVHQPPNQVFVSTWTRLLVPMTGADGSVTGFVGFNLPENTLRAGLEVVPAPILITDQIEVVRFANRAAREAFDAGQYGPWNRSLFDYAGIDLSFDVPPGELVLQGSALDATARQIAHQRMHHIRTRITGILHHGTAFYLVMLLPDPA